ncbi:Cyclin-dependent kinase 1 [Hypsizygus marmoreus]|uniref:non-specific serine/threonine protein kinase n=1 Tax=Hypsizygus marmoreus TaxID=39966 RepID=A0A369JT02_HYPMA|nr:Cyclin-dependent kinase 1 [Hypsizygus marmoreus]
MRQVIRLSSTVTLRLQPRTPGSPSPSPKNLRIRIKPRKAGAREALAGITNVAAGADLEADNQSTLRKNVIVLPPRALTGLNNSIDASLASDFAHADNESTLERRRGELRAPQPPLINAADAIPMAESRRPGKGSKKKKNLILLPPRSRARDDTKPPTPRKNVITIPARRKAAPLLSPISSPTFQIEPAVLPGPFLHVRMLRNGGHSSVVIVRDMDGGRSFRGRPLCAKIVTREQDRTTMVCTNEVAAYKALCAFAREGGQRWLSYVMRLEAMLEEAYRSFFIMDMMNCDLMDVLGTWEYELRKIHKKQWVAQIATGLAAIHAAGVIHRDLKPENIFLDFRCNIRIGDFGCAYTTRDGCAVHSYGTYCSGQWGTWPYQAPEILPSTLHYEKKYSLGVDYWALGCILFELELEDTRTLFETEADLWAYEKFHPLYHDGRSYFQEVGISLCEDADALISGLLRPRPTLRFGFQDVRRHPYFKRTDGSNEFDGIEARGRAINDLIVGAEVPRDCLSKGDESLVIYSPVAGGDQSNSWINPQGIWGNNRDI